MDYRFSSLLALSSSLFLAACGSEVVTSTSGTTSGAGGSSGSSTTTGSGGSTGECPASEPQAGTPCSLPAGQMCSYGSCCPDAYQCVNGSWQFLALPCPGPTACPQQMPVTGESCNVCLEGPCTYACPFGSDQVVAVCQEPGTWAVGECPTPPPDVVCGGATCKPGEVCVQKEGGPGFSYTCAPNPCGSQPLSCACANDLCGGGPETCTSTMGAFVYCSCPTCA